MCLWRLLWFQDPAGVIWVYWLPVMFSFCPSVNWAGLLCRRAGVLGRVRIRANLHSSDHSLHNICNTLMMFMHSLIKTSLLTMEEKKKGEALAVDLWRGNHSFIKTPISEKQDFPKVEQRQRPSKVSNVSYLRQNHHSQKHKQEQSFRTGYIIGCL